MREILILTRRELRSAFRETSVVLYSVLLPLLLYPFLLWLMVTTLTYIQGQQERRTYRIAYHEDLSGANLEFVEWLKSRERLNLISVKTEQKGVGLFDALLQARSEPGEEEVLLISFVGDRPESKEALDRLTNLQHDFNEEARARWFKEQGLNPEAARPFEIRGVSTAASGDVGGYLLGALLPIGLLVMIALGGAYPAIDTTAGERERGTWETLQSCGPSLTSIMASKYLFVAIICSLSGMLNLLAMLVSIRSIVAPILRESSSITFEVGPVTFLILICGVISVAFFVAGALMLCAIFARTFREGQALTTPMFMVIALPVLPLSDPSLQLNSQLAWLPLVNLALVWRQALQGKFDAFYIGQTFLTLLVMIGICLWVGSRLLGSEALMRGQGIEPTWRAIRRVWRSSKGG